jgi:hypothetical protein
VIIWTNRLSKWCRDRPSVVVRAQEKMEVIFGTIQRVNYRQRELRVIAKGRAWCFTIPDTCELWFDGVRAVLRCFHPLDPVTVHYECKETVALARAVYSWEPA